MESLKKPRVERVLIILKETCLRMVQSSPDSAKRLKQLEVGVNRRKDVEAADREHEDTFLAVRLVLQRLGISFKSVYRQNLTRKHFQGVDMIITVGGDGTFLTSTHFVSGVPMLGVNSAPSSSHGKYCLANAFTFATILGEIISGKRQPTNLLRLQLTIDGQPLSVHVMNELLVHDEAPPGACRYYLDVNGVQERQLSSGIYVATPAGSTGSIRSAGGRVMPLASGKWQYYVREPFLEPGEEPSLEDGTVPGEKWQLMDGILDSDDTLVITSEMWDGVVFVDGKNSGIKYPFPRGAQLTVRPAPLPLVAYVDPAANDRYQRIVRR